MLPPEPGLDQPGPVQDSDGSPGARELLVVRDLAPKEIVAHAALAAVFTQAPSSVAIHLCQSYEEA